MKTSFKSSEIAHIWAHKSAPRGTSPGAMSFEGDAFRSYGTVIARHSTHKGKAAILVDVAGHSVSTSKHQNIVQSAIPSGVPVFQFGCQRGDSLNPTPAQLFDYAVEQAASFQKQAEKARIRSGDHQASAARALERAREINEFFGLRRKVDEKTIARLRAASAKAEREAKAAAEKAAIKRRAEQQESFENWLACRQAEYFNASLFPVSFRIEGTELVSTLGARVPVQAARIAHRFALSKRVSGWHRNGDTCEIGNYQLDAVNAQGVVAGCHRISWEEIERLSAILTA